jgi:translation initiation factor 3 subunit M
MPAVSQLEKDEKYQLVYELLKIFLTKRLDSYLEFQTANSALLKDYGIFSARPVPMFFSPCELKYLVHLGFISLTFDEQSTGLVHEECVTKMRLMSLLDLSSRCSGEIPYSAITVELRVNCPFLLAVHSIK